LDKLILWIYDSFAVIVEYILVRGKRNDSSEVMITVFPPEEMEGDRDWRVER
jgi:hypothetical protein